MKTVPVYEAKTRLSELLAAVELGEEVTITRPELEAMRNELSAPGGKIDFALYGCPHFTIDQVAVIAEMVKGRRLAVPLFIMTSSLTRSLAAKDEITTGLKNGEMVIIEGLSSVVDGGIAQEVTFQ